MKKKGQSATYIIILACILLTKVLGMLRNSFLSAAYGTGTEATVFQAISKLPLTLYDVTLGTDIVSAFIPVFNELFTKEDVSGKLLTEEVEKPLIDRAMAVLGENIGTIVKEG
jgi:peptidoglycan biosynthesis protein MviN/MurJ (putative lipid II flippase)